MGSPSGTLIVVVLKARNLPNKQRIGKQDPYATCTYLSHRKRTKTDKRGGQHPVWDDELRFDIYENIKDVLSTTSVSTTSTGGIVPVKSNSAIGTAGSAGVKELRVAVYADDPRDPDLIGEGKVDLTDTLKKGEFDDWVTITNKGKYQGEIYLEMTFYSAKPPPDQRKTPSGHHHPLRAGIFEASSPATATPTPTPTKTSNSISSPIVKSKSPSPSIQSIQTLDPNPMPSAIRLGSNASPHPRPSSGHLPLPGEPSSINSRQRSSGSLSFPTPHLSLQSNQTSSRPPSRNQTLDQSNHLINSISSLSISNQSPLHQPQPNLSTPPTSSDLQPIYPLQPPPPTNQRPHRHSFSGLSHHPNSLIPSTPSPTPQFQNPIQLSESPYHHPSISQPTNHPYPSTQLNPKSSRLSLTPRRPLPIPGDNSNPSNSTWLEYQNHSNSNPSIPIDPPQNQSSSFSHHSTNEIERPSSRVSVFSNNTIVYGHPNQYDQGTAPLNSAHQQAIPHHQPHPPYSELSRPYHIPHPPQPEQAVYVPFNLPPPPPGQAPVPIHEVFGTPSVRPLPATNPPHYIHHNTFHHSHNVFSNPPKAETGTSYEGGPQDSKQHVNLPYSSTPETAFSANHYQSHNAPPPPPPHLKAQLQYQPYRVHHQPINTPPHPSLVQQLPPPPPQAPIYHQASYANAPITAPVTGFNPSAHQQYLDYNYYHGQPVPVATGHSQGSLSLNTQPIIPQSAPLYGGGYQTSYSIRHE
ncbi:hypothetical protein O181_026711 [Austropuccinia psidii MF-1]|uniref:C2 domain-containing protein n=1 Tax=Austropuccinia psidii MF-1 TaxID=1389203 RepID=A0A9Q3CR03_9BASI|nr:hypothetical protein [Austropuccinia psidii MF-1]